MSIQNDWNTIGNTYGNLNDEISKSKFTYLEINNDDYLTNPEIVNIGCLCNDHSTNNRFTLSQIWKLPDTMLNNLANAKKITNDFYWVERKNINTNLIQKKPGLSCKTNSSKDYAFKDPITQKLAPNINCFESVEVTTYMNDFNNPLQANTAIDLFGYFYADTTGDWTFTILPSDGNLTFSSLWISNDNAVYDYTNYNSDIKFGSNNSSFTITLVQGEYYPIRLQIASMLNSPTSNGILSITTPTGSLITNNSNNNFVTFQKSDGSIYFKQLMYYCFIQNEQNTNMYDTFFIMPGETDNYKSIKKLKNNYPLQLTMKNIPITITYSGKETIKKNNSTPISIKLPKGVNIQIVNAKWGILIPATIIYYVPVTVPAIGTVQNTTGSITGAAKTSEAGQTLNYALQAYNYPSSKIIQEKHTKIMDLSTDVTTKVQTIVNKNSLAINPTYTDLFGDPTATYMLADNYTKEIQITYSYNSVVDQSTISQLFLYLNNNGQAKIGYIWDNINCESDFNFDTPYNPCNLVCNYKLLLDNTGKLCIFDGTNMITSKNIAKILNLDLSKCVSNPEWLGNPNYKNFLNLNEKLGTGGVDKLISANGLFRLYFSNNDLILEYCLSPNNLQTPVRLSDTTINIHYTNKKNIDLYNYQINYFYRFNTRGLSGKKFLAQIKGANTKLNLLPSTPIYDNILKFDSFETKNNLYPLSFPLDGNPNYTVMSQNVGNENVCKENCINNLNCDHYFFLTDKNNNNYCILDNKNIVNPVYTTTNISNVQSSTFNKKNYYINTTCGSLPNTAVKLIKDNSVNVSELGFKDLAENAPNLTYYCGLDQYKDASKKIMDIYNSNTPSNIPSNTSLQGFRNIENFTNNDKKFYIKSPYKITNQSNINYINNMTSDFTNYSNIIGNNNMTINNTIGKYVDLSNNLGLNINYKFNGDDAIIPNKYNAKLSDKPETTLNDALKRDLEIINAQQNALYTVATITTASLLVMMIFVMK